jgi:hypothetical protein
MRLIRLFNEDSGKQFLDSIGLESEMIEKLPYMGISCVCNLLSSIKLAKYFELGENDIIVTVFTDSMDLYNSRIREMKENIGSYDIRQAELDWQTCMINQSIDYLTELTYHDKKRIHNLKYFTWIEQQGKNVEELNDQWYKDDYWTERFSIVDKWDKLISEFNSLVLNK